MVRKLGRRLSWSRSFSLRKMFEGSPARLTHGHGSDRETVGPYPRCDGIGANSAGPKPKHHPSDMEVMKERFAKLLLGEDMSGGANGVSSALALSNAIAALADSVFGDEIRLQAMHPETKARWRKEMDWSLSVADHVVQFVPSRQMTKNGGFTEIMVTKQRDDLQMNIPALRKLDWLLLDILDNFKYQNEFEYVAGDFGESENSRNWRKDDKWWVPTVKVPSNGLSDETRKWLLYQKDSVTQVLKAAMAINAQSLSEMEIPETYIESLPKNGKTSLGDFIYRSITEDYFDAEYFLSSLDLSTEHKVVDLKNRIEASIVIWKRKKNQKDNKSSSWGPTVRLEKRELFEERAETILVSLRQQFPGIPQSALDKSKIQHNKDVGTAILESYSRTLERLAFTVMSRIEDVLEVDALAQRQWMGDADGKYETETESGLSSDFEDTEKVFASETPNSRKLSDFIGWKLASESRKHHSMGEFEIYHKGLHEKVMIKSPRSTPKKFSYLEKLENLRTPSERH